MAGNEQGELRAALTLIAAIAIGAVECGGNPIGNMQVCPPGMSVACACPSGLQGAQICAADGTHYDVCVCTGGGTGGKTGAGGAGVGTTGAGGKAGSGGVGAGGFQGGGGVQGSGGFQGSGGVQGRGGAGGFNVRAQCPSGVKNKGVCVGTEPACFNTCGPLKSGIKDCDCVAGAWSCPTCSFDPTHDYSCYSLRSVFLCPADPTDPSGMNLPQTGTVCNLPTCLPCGSGTANAYRDPTNTPKIGYCVCSASDGTGTYSCASTQEWPPQ